MQPILLLAEVQNLPFLSGGGSASNGYTVVAQTLARLGVRHMFGVIGIPVTELASAAQVGCMWYITMPHRHPLTAA